MTSVESGLVSTVIPVYNRPGLLREAVESVLAQTYRPIEILIVDDGSTDGTAATGEALAAVHPEVRYLRHERRRVAEARNTGIRAARGEFMQFLDSDDLLMPEKFARQIEGLRARPECDVSYCGTRVYRPEQGSRDVPARATGVAIDSLFPSVLFGRVWETVTPLFRRSVIDRAGFFRTISVLEDWEYECRIGALGVKLSHCPDLLADKRNLQDWKNGEWPGIKPTQLADYAWLQEHAYACASRAGVGAADLDRFSRIVARVGRRCAEVGLEDEARRSLALARKTSLRASVRAAINLYCGASDMLGWRPTAWILGHVWPNAWSRWWFDRTVGEAAS